MDIVLFEVALRVANSKTVQALHCVCGDLTKSLEEVDFWKLKFERDYNPLHYHDWWTSKENYQLQEKGGLFQFVVTSGDAFNVDYVLYKKCYRRARLVSMADDLINHGIGYSAPTMVDIDLSQPLQRYLVLEEGEFNSLCFYTSVTNLEEASKTIKTRYLEENEGRNTPLSFYFVVVDFTKLVLEFSIPKDADWRYFAGLEETLKEKYCWDVSLYDDYTNELEIIDEKLGLGK